MAETVAILLIGDGVLAVVAPAEHVRLWRKAPSGFAKVRSRLGRNHNVTRLVGLVEVALGLFVAKVEHRKRRTVIDRLF